MVDLLKFTFNKKILNRVVIAKFCLEFNYIGLKKKKI